jgi:hypothetical protein
MTDPGAIKLPDDEHLDKFERWVRHLLEGTVGFTRVTDLKGGPQGRHDLEADLPDGRIAAIEITSEADRDRLSVAGAVRRHLSGLTVPGSPFAWHVNVTSRADAAGLRGTGGLAALLLDMSERGCTSASALSDYRDPWRDRLEALGIQSVHGFPGTAYSGAVFVVNDVMGGYGWVRATADEWITTFLKTGLCKKKLAKLARAVANERHLAILIHPDTDAGHGIVGALANMRDEVGLGDLPSCQPPAPLTHLWLIAPTVPARAFLWARNSGWTVVTFTDELLKPTR